MNYFSLTFLQVILFDYRMFSLICAVVLIASAFADGYNSGGYGYGNRHNGYGSHYLRGGLGGRLGSYGGLNQGYGFGNSYSQYGRLGGLGQFGGAGQFGGLGLGQFGSLGQGLGLQGGLGRRGGLGSYGNLGSYGYGRYGNLGSYGYGGRHGGYGRVITCILIFSNFLIFIRFLTISVVSGGGGVHVFLRC